jgi:hypothetical protein
MTLMGRVVAQRPDLKLLLMSATLTGGSLSSYYAARAAGMMGVWWGRVAAAWLAKCGEMLVCIFKQCVQSCCNSYANAR